MRSFSRDNSSRHKKPPLLAVAFACLIERQSRVAEHCCWSNWRIITELELGFVFTLGLVCGDVNNIMVGQDCVC